MSLQELLQGIAPPPPRDARIEDLTLDSRAVVPGGLFLALRGRRTHGLAHAAEAVARGAQALLWEPAEGAPPPPHGELPALAVPGLSALGGAIADRFFAQPSARLRVTGITGTNGKTTCAYLLARALERLGRPAGYAGTLGWGRIGALQDSLHTTADAVSVHRSLAQLHAAGVREVAMEVSSHALDQGRVDAVRFHTAAFTNLTRDHLDYHGSMAAYGAAKAKLFDLPGLAHRVFNVGDPFGRDCALRHAGAAAPLTAVWVGEEPFASPAARTLRAREVRLELRGLSLTVQSREGEQPLATHLLGRFNAENLLVALGCLTALDVPLAAAAAALTGCEAPPGRMELVLAADGAKPLAVIDYAHTPDALEKALRTLREHCRGTLWCVFGCGGERDAGKRAQMGAVADQLADELILTDDNPRGEDPAAITRDILEGIRRRAPRVLHDRAQAIAAALGAATAADIVLIAGKGHEDYQIYGATRRSFSDRREAQRQLGVAA